MKRRMPVSFVGKKSRADATQFGRDGLTANYGIMTSPKPAHETIANWPPSNWNGGRDQGWNRWPPSLESAVLELVGGIALYGRGSSDGQSP